MLDYQDALWPTGTIDGERGCTERWALIAPELPNAGILLDIGSNLGFYGISAVRQYRDVAVLSIEADSTIAAEQARIVAANRLNRILILEASLNAELAEKWVQTCEMVDSCLLLSVAHWFDDPARVLAALNGISRTMVIELPDAEDAGACGDEKRALWGKDPSDWLRSITRRNVRLIGRPARHTSGVNSWLFVVDGPVERFPRLPYMGSGYEHPQGRDYRLSADGAGTRLWVRGAEREWISGVNIANLAAVGRCRYPDLRQLRGMWREASGCARDHLDPAPHNVLWGADGFSLIDGDDLDGRIDRPDRQMRLFLKSWVRHPGYNDSAVARIGAGRLSRLYRQVTNALPAPLKRPLRVARRVLRFRHGATRAAV